MEHTGIALRVNTCKLAPFGSYRNTIDERVITAEGLYVYSSHVSKGTIMDPWPTPRNVAPGVFFVLMIDDFVIYIWSNLPCGTGWSNCFVQIQE